MNDNNITDAIYEAIIAYHENSLTQDQAHVLLAWIEESADNLEYLRETGKILNVTRLLRKSGEDTGEVWNELVSRIEEKKERPFPKPAIKLTLSALYRAAAVVLILIAAGIGTIFIFRNPAKAPAHKYFEAVAPKGSRSVITLSDGSVVWLNSGTTLKYQPDFGKTSRNVILDGEAYFSVAENRDKPFTVTASEIIITAIGTSFNVKAYSDEDIVETTLETGEIRIDNIDNGGRNASAKPVFLKPNQKAVYLKSSGNVNISDKEKAVLADNNQTRPKVKPVELKIDSLVDTKLSTSWKDSRWIFKSERLSNLVPILERRYDIDITFADSALVNYKFSGTLREESLKQVLNALTSALPIIRYEISENVVSLYEDKEMKDRFLRQN